MIHFLLIILSTISDVHSIDLTKTAVQGEFTYFVTIRHQNQYRCSGTIIDRRHILTRAYCVSGIQSSGLSVIAGTLSTIDLRRKRYLVQSIHIHYGFEATIDSAALDRIYWVHDIAILKLTTGMIWDSFLAPLKLISGDYDWNLKHECIVPGWRQTTNSTNASTMYIRWIEANIVSDHECGLLGVRFLKNEKCAVWYASDDKAMTYYSGSPIVCDNVFVGIIDGRQSQKFDILLNLVPYLDFIAHIIDDTITDVNPGKAPYVVSVWNQDSFKCGGIIVDDLHIFTTGYCVRYETPTDLQVIAGHTQVLKKNQRIKWLSVHDIDIHAGYDEIIHVDGPKSMQIKNNYAILKLTERLVWGLTIRKAPLSITSFVVTGVVCKAFRWHYAYSVDDEVLLQLVWSQEFLIAAEDYHGAGFNLEVDEFGVKSQYVQRPMDVDSSGNPVVCGGSVIGIIIPDFSILPQGSCLRSVLNIASFRYLLDNVCYGN